MSLCNKCTEPESAIERIKRAIRSAIEAAIRSTLGSAIESALQLDLQLVISDRQEIDKIGSTVVEIDDKVDSCTVP
jgi:hypothetical protein